MELEDKLAESMKEIFKLISEEDRFKLAQETISSKDPFYFLHSYIVKLGKYIVDTNDIVNILTFVETVPFISVGTWNEIFKKVKKMNNPAYTCMLAIKACKYSHPTLLIKFAQAVIETNDIKYITYFYLNLVNLGIELPQEVRNIITEKLNDIGLDSYRFLNECLCSKEKKYLSFADELANALKTEEYKDYKTKQTEFELARLRIRELLSYIDDIQKLIRVLNEYIWIYTQIYNRKDLYDKCENMIKKAKEVKEMLLKIIDLYKRIPYHNPSTYMEILKLDELKIEISSLEEKIEQDLVIPLDMLDVFDKLIDYLAFKEPMNCPNIYICYLIIHTRGLTQANINTLMNALINKQYFNDNLVHLAYTSRYVKTDIDNEVISKTVNHIIENTKDISSICKSIRKLLIGAFSEKSVFGCYDLDKIASERVLTDNYLKSDNQLRFTKEMIDKTRPLYFTHKCIVELVKYIAERKNIVDILTLIDEVPFIPSAAWDEIFKAVKEMNEPTYTYMLAITASKNSHPALLIKYAQAVIETNDAKYISYFYLNLINLNIEVPKEVIDIILEKLNNMGLESWLYLFECNKQDYLYMAEKLETALKNNDLERLEEFGVSQVSNQKVYTYNSKVEVHSGDD